MMDQFALNAVGPALVFAPCGRPAAARQGVRVCRALARVGRSGDNRIGGWISYRSAKAALNQIVHTSAIELARSHRHSICVALHPGTVKNRFHCENTLPVIRLWKPSEAAGEFAGCGGQFGPRKTTGQFFDWSGKPVPW